MSKTAQYLDLGKEPLEFAKRGFPENGTTKILHETKTPLGALLKSNASSGPKGLVLTTEPEYKTKFGTNPLTFKAKYDSAALGEASITVADVAALGIEVKPFVKRASVKPPGAKEGVLESTGGFQLGYAHESINFNFKAEALTNVSRQRFDAALVVQAPQNVFWAGSAKYVHFPEDKEKKEWDYNLKLHYAQPSSSLTVAYEVDEKTDKRGFNFTFFQTVNESTKVATQFAVLPEPQATVTADSKWDSATSVKSKLTAGNASRVGLAYTQTVTKFATVTLGADLSVNKLFGGVVEAKDDHAFGFELKLKE
jgi:hypothetical protein